jgi:cellulose synthase/poly-beta-1,6-N-acetylglucosamine synthase-like glycosyltransferase
MPILGTIVFVIYTVALAYITIYCLFQFNLLYHYKRGHAQAAAAKTTSASTKKVHSKEMAIAGDLSDEGGVEALDISEYPFVTVQLPIFNELYVVERLIDTVALFDYPKDRFEIQVLDDSTDETVDITRKKVEEYQAKGFDIVHITRTDRKGYKAGALKEATEVAKGKFIAIFDADFLPRADFLKITIPYFQDEKVGVVQTRWEHINGDYSLITRLQALQLNVHFTVEQRGRMSGKHMLQFNGTAGVWRRQTIKEAGGWEADTLTEDLDLSIRAQLKGWKIHFLEEIGSPAELPIEMNSLKSQQFRWMKGGAETAKKMLPTIWKSEMPFMEKIHTTVHLMASSIFVFVFIIGVFSVPLLFFIGDMFDAGISKNFFGVFLAGFLSVVAIYYVANVQAVNEKNESPIYQILKFVLLFPLFLSLSMGLSLHNTIAVIQGFSGKKSPFVRTPKFNIKNLTDSLKSKKYVNYKLSWTTIFEGVLSLYFLGAIFMGIMLQNTTFIFFHLMLFLGYGGIFYYTVKHLRVNE